MLSSLLVFPLIWLACGVAGVYLGEFYGEDDWSVYWDEVPLLLMFACTGPFVLAAAILFHLEDWRGDA